MDYSMEELLPLVAELTDKFTSRESTSVTYERAAALMEAVLYCTRLGETAGREAFAGQPAKTENDALQTLQKPTARQAYQAGCDRLKQLVQAGKEQYKQLMLLFRDYGNENLRDTVTKALPGFYTHYDLRFAPQETIITMDYPTLGIPNAEKQSMTIPNAEKQSMGIQNTEKQNAGTQETGILAVLRYQQEILWEQEFLHAFSEEHVKAVLKSYQADYRIHFFNLCRILLRHVLGCMLLGQRPGEMDAKTAYQRLTELVQTLSREELTGRLLYLTELCITSAQKKKQDSAPGKDQTGDLGQRQDRTIKQQRVDYFKRDIEDFVTDLTLGAKEGCMQRMILL